MKRSICMITVLGLMLSLFSLGISADSTVPDGYRLLTKEDEGKTFGVELEPYIWIDTSSFKSYSYSLDSVTLLESPAIYYDCIVSSLVDDSSASARAPSGFITDPLRIFMNDVCIYDHSLIVNPEGFYWISESVSVMCSTALDCTVSGFSDVFYNDWLFVKDVPGSILGGTVSNINFNVLSETVGILPICLPVMISFIALRKGICFIKSILVCA